MKTINDNDFWKKIFPKVTRDMEARSCGYKRVIPFKESGQMVIGIFKSELNKHMFFMLVDPSVKTNVHSLFGGLYYIAPGLDTSGLLTDKKDKFQVPSSKWQFVANLDQLAILLGKTPKTTPQMNIGFDIHTADSVEKMEKDLEIEPVAEELVQEEYNEINPAHYKAGDIESIDVIKSLLANNYNLGNAFKYMARCGKKPGVTPEKDLKKAIWYLFNEMTTHLSKEELLKFVQEEVIPKHCNPC